VTAIPTFIPTLRAFTAFTAGNLIEVGFARSCADEYGDEKQGRVNGIRHVAVPGCESNG
jgi:hypothetical protein